MPHRDLKAWEVCAPSPLTGAHTWEYTTKLTKGELIVAAVECRFCKKQPPDEEAARLMAEFEVQKRRDRIDSGFRNDLKDATQGKRKAG